MAKEPPKDQTNCTELCFRVILVGNPRVGKTSIINRIVNNKFEDESPSTPEGSVIKHTWTTRVENTNVILEIMDCAGEEDPRKYRANFFRNVDAVVMAYDQTKKDSYKFIQKAMDELERLCDKHLSKIAVFAVGNKSDLPIAQLQIYSGDAERFFGDKATYYQTSAKANANIDHLFDTIAKETTVIFHNSITPSITPSVTLSYSFLLPLLLPALLFLIKKFV
jgi:small GTP-binding protein